ncbi:chondroitin proteoglycan 1 [Spodoptera frugiperda]|uniref:Phospholipase A2 n=1 Tax=Spodoptera frugiperda TaxID=7108 RepID=A0A9R0ER30_SPOFR|nr:chondroitin proteoglycan 1 [Spodoptera frugiperda]
MYHRGRKKMRQFIISTLLVLSCPAFSHAKSIVSTQTPTKYGEDNLDNSIIDFDEEYSLKYNKKYGMIPWNSNENFNKESHRYTIIKDFDKKVDSNRNRTETKLDITSTTDYSVIPLELLSTTENVFGSLFESTIEPDLTVIPLSTTRKAPKVIIEETVTLPSSTPETDTSTYYSDDETTTATDSPVTERYTIKQADSETTTVTYDTTTDVTELSTYFPATNATEAHLETSTVTVANTTKAANLSRLDFGSDEDSDVPIFTELDTEVQEEVPEDYYDAKDVVPTTVPKTDALSVIFGLAGSVVESVVESVAERVVPKGIVDLFRRMQRQSEMLEAERLRSREENGGIGQFGRGILKTISSGISKPLSQLMAGARDIGSLDNDRGFVASLASGVTSVANVANSLADTFKDRVQAIYPGTVWCGDGRSATARSSDLGLFFFTDTCCRQHDACKLYIKAGETKYGLTNTGLFTRSHCSCDAKFRECLRRTNSLVSAQIGVTYFNILGPQCFRNAHPIVKCVRKTRITGQKCEEYELDYTKPKMWQWFDNETF